MHPVGSHLAQACCPCLRHRAQPAELISVRYQAGGPAKPVQSHQEDRNGPGIIPPQISNTLAACRTGYGTPGECRPGPC
jgi:hypothetical protein